MLEQLRPADTVTICLPLFLAGGEGDRAFAKFYPTIAVDGCELRCAARATEMYSSKPAASVMVRDLIAENGLDQPEGRRRLNAAGLQAVDVTAERIADPVDELLDKRWDRRAGTFAETISRQPCLRRQRNAEKVATCSCGSGIPIQKVIIAGQEVTLVALPLIFQQFREAAKPPARLTLRELMETVKIYNPIPAEAETGLCSRGLQANMPPFGTAEPTRRYPMSQTATYHTTVTWKGEHWGHIVMGNGPEMDFSAPPDAQGHPGVFTPEDAFVAAANTCIMMMFIWAAERFKLNLLSYDCRAEGTKLIELDRTEIFTHLRFWPVIRIAAGGEEPAVVEARTRRALQSAQKYSLVANSVKSEIIIEPKIEIVP